MRVTLALQGVTPLVLHNPRLADPLDTFTRKIKEITGKRVKTDADHEDIAHLEWEGGLYYDPEMGVYVPTSMVLRAVEEAAKITKQGTQIMRALAMTTDAVSLEYDGPRKPEEMWAQPVFTWRASVGVNRKRVMRVRPIFRKWGATVDVELQEDVMNLDDLQRIVELAGRVSGLGDARRLGRGRFEATVTAA